MRHFQLGSPPSLCSSALKLFGKIHVFVSLFGYFTPYEYFTKQVVFQWSMDESNLPQVSIAIIYSFRIFHISASWWSSTGVWVTARLLKSPGLFSVFWPFSIMLSFGWSPHVGQLPSPPGPFIILFLLYQKHQLQLV